MNSASKERLVHLLTQNVLAESTSWSLEQLASELPENNEEAAAKFCDDMELGNWFYESMVLNGVDITKVLIDLGIQRKKEEAEASRDRHEVIRDLQTM